ncbi:MAG: DUF2835 domain-containing protein [Nitrospirales bacterium]|nr:DUF2835 domain-containing protein [Nitrospira sp.]MDR4500159.1 DUF2835 domain-containing protein [Nitrospirales bacterium]
MAMSKIRVQLNLPPHRFLAYYEGMVDDVVARASDGRRVRFPARVLRPFMTQQGVVGSFFITYDGNKKFISIERTSDGPAS